MTIEFSCECGKLLRVKEALAGKRVKCLKCGAAVQAPAPNAAAEAHVKTPPSKDKTRNAVARKASAGLLFGGVAAALAVLLIGAGSVAVCRALPWQYCPATSA